MIQIIRSCDNSFSLNSVSGPLLYRLTNDYLFRALLQENNEVLKGLICSLLHVSPEQIHSASIENSIELGNSISEKTFFLNVKVLMNNSTIINLEMQILNIGNWPERSLSYLCRSFDQLYKGQDYAETKPVIHIGILDFTLFPEHPEFYATYKLMNVKNHTIYSDKFQLSVLDLKHTDLATAQDKRYQINLWAGLFKATTWEEIKMFAEKNEFISGAAKTLYQLSADEKIRRQCEEREEYYRVQRTIAREKQQALDELAHIRSELVNTQSELTNTQSALTNTQSKLTNTQSALTNTQSELTNTQSALTNTQSELTDARQKIASLQSQIEALRGRPQQQA